MTGFEATSGVDNDRTAKPTPPSVTKRRTVTDGQAAGNGYDRRNARNATGVMLALANVNFRAYSEGVLRCRSAIPIVHAAVSSVNAENQRLTGLCGLARKTKIARASKTVARASKPMGAISSLRYPGEAGESSSSRRCAIPLPRSEISIVRHIDRPTADWCGTWLSGGGSADSGGSGIWIDDGNAAMNQHSPRVDDGERCLPKLGRAVGC
jgi:hypothetical protein